MTFNVINVIHNFSEYLRSFIPSQNQRIELLTLS